MVLGEEETRTPERMMQRVRADGRMCPSSSHRLGSTSSKRGSSHLREEVGVVDSSNREGHGASLGEVGSLKGARGTPAAMDEDVEVGIEVGIHGAIEEGEEEESPLSRCTKQRITGIQPQLKLGEAMQVFGWCDQMLHTFVNNRFVTLSISHALYCSVPL